MSEKIKCNINVYGAFDRFNYGDLLFPMIIKNALNERLTNTKYNFYGTVESDLSDMGGVPTRSIKRLLNCSGSIQGNNCLIIAGGDILGVSFPFSHLCLLRSVLARSIFQKVYKNISAEKATLISKWLLGLTKLQLPFIVDKKKVPGYKVIYNSVGGVMKSEKESGFSALREADFISVRDIRTLSELKTNVPNVHLIPDSAVIMSKFYPKDTLETLVSNKAKEQVQSLVKGNYICFQIVLSSYRQAAEVVVDSLKHLMKTLGVPVLLLAIGRAYLHEDQIALRDIAGKMPGQCFFSDDDSIYDIMYKIAHAKVFLGTSLHGNITALSYGIPHVGINPNVKKLDSHFKTWLPEINNGCVAFKDICESGVNACKIKRKILCAKKDKLISLVEKQFDAIANIIES